MPRALTALLATLVATSAFAQEPPALIAPTSASDAPFEVVRLGDSSLSCEALVGEIGTLNQQMMAAQQDMTAIGQDMSRDAMQSMRQRPGGGLATGLGGLAASFIPGAGMVMGAAQAVEQQAAASQMRSRQEAMQQRMQALSESAMMMGPISQRVEHLSEIARDRSC